MSAILLPIQNVVDLFRSDLANVRFGDLDADALAKTSAAVEIAAADVAAAEAALAAARSKLHEHQEMLLQQAHRALAYARVYAESDETLSARLEAIALPRPKKARAEGTASVPAPREREIGGRLSDHEEGEAERRPRGRPRKIATVPAEPLLTAIAAEA